MCLHRHYTGSAHTFKCHEFRGATSGHCLITTLREALRRKNKNSGTANGSSRADTRAAFCYRAWHRDPERPRCRATIPTNCGMCRLVCLPSCLQPESDRTPRSTKSEKKNAQQESEHSCTAPPGDLYSSCGTHQTCVYLRKHDIGCAHVFLCIKISWRDITALPHHTH